MKFGLTHDKYKDFDKWYQELITRCKLISYYDISGCYILLPNSYALWENIIKFLDSEFKEHDIENVYFPLLITEDNLNTEKEHIEDFKPEVAWVTHHGDSKLEVKLAIRPTSETAIYPSLKDIIKSTSDLPLKYNQYCNTVRWEFSDCTPFIRSREFLWNEGHCSFETDIEALQNSEDMIDLYHDIYKDVLCVATIKGRKTQMEKFAGAISTFTLETFLDGANRAVQCCTSHYLGDKFSKMFDITFYNEELKKHTYVHQTSFGFTTRSIGVLLMQHCDNKGLVIPPDIARKQFVIIPITTKDNRDQILGYCSLIKKKLKKYRVSIDSTKRGNGFKYNECELFGVPFQIRVGKKEFANQEMTIVDRLRERFTSTLDTIKQDSKVYINSFKNKLYESALGKLNQSIVEIDTLKDLDQLDELEHKMYQCSFCGSSDCERKVKEKYHIKSLCIIEDLETGLNCVDCGKEMKHVTLFGRSY
jgi:prolyl-tRNA synthetase family I